MNFMNLFVVVLLHTVAVGAKPVYVANTYPPAVTPTRPVATAYKFIQTTPLSASNAVSYASYAYQPVATPSVVVCSQSIVSTPAVVRTSTVSSTAAVAGSMGRIPSLVSGNILSVWYVVLHLFGILLLTCCITDSNSLCCIACASVMCNCIP